MAMYRSSGAPRATPRASGVAVAALRRPQHTRGWLVGGGAVGQCRVMGAENVRVGDMCEGSLWWRRTSMRSFPDDLEQRAVHLGERVEAIGARRLRILYHESQQKASDERHHVDERRR